MKYYLVVAKCGHVGNKKYIDIFFPIRALSKSDAAQAVLKRKKVKKHLKDAITSVEEISFDRYVDLCKNNPHSSYLRSHYSNEFDLCDYEVKTLPKRYEKKVEFESRSERVAYILKRNKERYCSCMEMGY